MIRYLYADQLKQFPKLRDAMFRDRADQFKTRLNWDVDIDENGFEKDQYDALNPLYVIWENTDGSHGGSMRFLPTTGRTMINEHFTQILGGGTITSPLIWECTRFCLNPDADSRVAAALMLAGGEIMQGFGVAHFAAVFDARMVRIYRMIGSSPEVMGSTGEGRDKISVGLWEFTKNAQAKVAAKADLSLELSRQWFELSFGKTQKADLAMTG
jgi:acyl homoserine lactone synthase